MKILRNAIRCKHCLSEIESKDIHDYKQCECGRVGIDGGRDYLKRKTLKNYHRLFLIFLKQKIIN